jgi:glucan phosphoethanolaminetransferase (alkaline phosphatase superfamily)
MFRRFSSLALIPAQHDLRDNTVVIFCSDHGESLGDHGLMFKGCRFCEGLVRVPLIFHGPNRFHSIVLAVLARFRSIRSFL